MRCPPWSPEMDASFSSFKKALDSTFLAHPRPGAALSHQLDALVTHIGGGLHQWRQGSVVRNLWVSFPRSWRLPRRGIQLLILTGAVGLCRRHPRHFRYMLKGRMLTIFTDHKPLLTYALNRVTLLELDLLSI
jgi:hypothetical protein